MNVKHFVALLSIAILLLGAAFVARTSNASLEASGAAPTTSTPVVAVPQTTEPPEPKTSLRLPGTLTLQADTSKAYFSPVSNDGPTELYAAVDVDAVDRTPEVRSALNLAIVIDRSGSMSGQKIANVRAGALNLLQKLNHDDRVAIVSYGSDVDVNVPSNFVNAEHRRRLVQAVRGMVVGGGTNLGGGLQRGIQEVMRPLRSSRSNNAFDVSRVLLMSDGNANVGVRSRQSYRNLVDQAIRSDISISTIGVGLDYNEDLMTLIGNRGGGNYHFVDQTTVLAHVLDAEFEGLSATVAKNASIELRFGQGVTMTELFGLPHRRVDGTVHVLLSSFRAGQRKSLLMRLSIAPTAPTDVHVFDAKLAYRDSANAGHMLLPTVQTGFLAAKASTDPDKLALKHNVKVAERLQQVEVAESMQKAMEFYEGGEIGQAKATIGRAQKRMRGRVDRFQPAVKKKFAAANAEMDRMAADMSASPSTRKGKRMVKERKQRSNAILLDANAF
jgi:Ca-activated chloride channel homolog